MIDDYKLVTGAWLDAIGTILSAIAEIRAFQGIDQINNQLVAVGEGLQAVGTMLVGTVTTDDPLNFAGNWIDGAGAATSSIAAYLQDVEHNTIGEEDLLRIEILGDSLQAMGASISALADHLIGEHAFAFGNGLQGLGGILEATGEVYELREREGQPLITLGAILQAIGSNFNAVVATRELIEADGL